MTAHSGITEIYDVYRKAKFHAQSTIGTTSKPAVECLQITHYTVLTQMIELVKSTLSTTWAV